MNIFVDIYSIIYIYYIKHNAMTWMRLRPPICWMTSLQERTINSYEQFEILTS